MVIHMSLAEYKEENVQYETAYSQGQLLSRPYGQNRWTFNSAVRLEPFAVQYRCIGCESVTRNNVSIYSMSKYVPNGTDNVRDGPIPSSLLNSL